MTMLYMRRAKTKEGFIPIGMIAQMRKRGHGSNKRPRSSVGRSALFKVLPHRMPRSSMPMPYVAACFKRKDKMTFKLIGGGAKWRWNGRLTKYDETGFAKGGVRIEMEMLFDSEIQVSWMRPETP